MMKRIATLLVVLSLGSGALAVERGDANSDGRIDLADSIWTYQWLYRDGPEAPCPDAADANADGVVDLSDVVFTLDYLYRGGAPSDGRVCEE